MGALHKESPTAGGGRASTKIVQAAELNTLRSRATRSPTPAIHYLTAQLAFLADWKEDIDRRIDRAMQLQDRGALFAQEQDDLIDAVRAWRLAAASVALHPIDVRRAA